VERARIQRLRDAAELLLFSRVRPSGPGKGREETIDSVDDPDAGTPLDPMLYLTIAELFNVVQDAIDAEAAQIDVSYDGVLGHPTSMFIDFEVLIADEEIGYTADQVVPVPEPSAALLSLVALGTGSMLGRRLGRNSIAP
jgi:hypothetical protein